MSNPFRKKTHELNENERLKQKARKSDNLEAQVASLKQALKDAQGMLDAARKSNQEAAGKVYAYEWLREQELMLMTPDGVKYLKGDDLDAYIKENGYPRLDLRHSILDSLAKQFSDAVDKGVANNLLWTDKALVDEYSYIAQGRNIYGNDAGKES